jgi:hypothetical protein
MPTFKGTDFEIELPRECSDESTYAFAFPARSNFRPSIVVKTERLAEPIDLPAYVEKQLENIKKLLLDVVVVRVGPEKHRELSAYASVYDWGEASRRVRQKQRYIPLNDPARVVTLTATCLREMYSQTQELFDAVIESFSPIEGHEKRF